MAITKRNVLEALATVDFTEDIIVGDVTVTPADIADFVETSLAQLDNRAAKAAERAANKRQEGDEVRSAIKDIIDNSETPMTIADILTALDNEEMTSAKVVARVGQLVKLGEVFKSDTKVDGRNLKIYSTTPFED